MVGDRTPHTLTQDDSYHIFLNLITKQVWPGGGDTHLQQDCVGMATKTNLLTNLLPRQTTNKPISKSINWTTSIPIMFVLAENQLSNFYNIFNALCETCSDIVITLCVRAL